MLSVIENLTNKEESSQKNKNNTVFILSLKGVDYFLKCLKSQRSKVVLMICFKHNIEDQINFAYFHILKI